MSFATSAEHCFDLVGRRGASSSSLLMSDRLLVDGGLENVRRGNSSPGCSNVSGGCLEAASSSQRATAESEVIFTPGLAPDSSSSLGDQMSWARGASGISIRGWREHTLAMMSIVRCCRYDGK